MSVSELTCFGFLIQFMFCISLLIVLYFYILLVHTDLGPCPSEMHLAAILLHKRGLFSPFPTEICVKTKKRAPSVLSWYLSKLFHDLSVPRVPKRSQA
jgi:hypothetical protein